MSSDSDEALSRGSQGQMLFPDKIFLKIIGQLSWRDINSCRLTCTRLYNLVSRNQNSLPRRRVHLVRIVFTVLTKQFVQDLFDGVVSGSITVKHFDLRQCRGPDDVLMAYVQRDFKFFLR
ncbi:unnamed protein product [Heligmosomoides polygyrus]|uniref:F-box domain-containing protein n=1 Tax=Heligmosomoides polygyrus TaxID=6339 RepID=A0A3P7Y3N6_HELPZ|nr:unnamed protein product [Heligmosomoides polygyrus]